METRAPTALAEHRLAIGEVEVTYFRGGRGPALVWLHGGDGSRADCPFLARLAGHFEVIAPVHPGFEQAPLPRWMDSVDDFAHLHIALLDKLGIVRAMLAGTSIGGWIAAEIATKNPGLARALALVAPVGVKVGPTDRLDIPDIFAMRDKPLRELAWHDPERGVIDAAKASEAELTSIARNRETLALVTWEPWMHNQKLRHRLASLAAPALFVRGASDGIVSADYLAGYARLLSGAKLTTIPAAGHYPHVEQPAALAAAIIEFARAAGVLEARS